jgi:(4S)-4-hydroxy-5-phosphonooxypentane-2,3-dione isomerase
MSAYAVAVTLRPKPEFRAQFRDAIVENARASRTTEPGCRQFDVCESADGNEVFLYEIYDDEAAFRAHLATDHFKRFDAVADAWLISKRIVTYRRIDP